MSDSGVENDSDNEVNSSEANYNEDTMTYIEPLIEQATLSTSTSANLPDKSNETSSAFPSPNYDSLRKLVHHLIENKGYVPHEEWNVLEKKLWGDSSQQDSESNQTTKRNTSSVHISHQQPLANVQWMKYKWVLICKHLEQFLREKIGMDISGILAQGKQETDEIKRDILDIYSDFDYILQCVEKDLQSNKPRHERQSIVREKQIQLQLLQSNNNDNDESYLNEASIVFSRPRSSSYSRSSDLQPLSFRLANRQPPPIPSRENRKPVINKGSTASENLHARVAKDLDIILKNHLRMNSDATPISETTEPFSNNDANDNDSMQFSQTSNQKPVKSKRIKRKKGKYNDTWDRILQVSEDFTPRRATEEFLFYSHDRDISIRLKELKYNRENVLKLLREYFVQTSIFEEVTKQILEDSSTADQELVTLQKISGLPRTISSTFDSIYEKYKPFLLKYGEILIREPTMFLRAFYFLHQENLTQAIIEDEKLFKYFSQILTVDEVLCILMYYGDEDVYTRLVVSVLDRYSTKHLRVFLLQILNSLSFFPDSMSSPDKPMFAFLIRRASEDFTISQHLNWHLTVSAEHPDLQIRGRYRSFQYRLLSALKLANANYLVTIINQQKLVQYLSDVSAGMKKMRISRKKKILLLRKILSNNNNSKKLPKFDWNALFNSERTFHLPLSTQELIGLDYEHASIFKSAMQPFRLPFIGRESNISLIWKFGDDLRQDECVQLFIGTIDHLLKEEYNLDLKLTTYGCLATSARSGFVELVPNVSTISLVRSENSSFLAYFEKCNSEEQMEEVLTNYTKSLAGYCIISYLLCIGDRHMENILLTQDGRIFHIDFGFILGYDPKPFAPKIRITEDMLDVFGGVDTPGFKAFSNYCSLALKYLRNHASLLITTMRMMALSNLPHVSEASINKTIVRNLRLDLKYEDACAYFRKIFSKSLIALAPKITERIHSIAQSFRD